MTVDSFSSIGSPAIRGGRGVAALAAKLGLRGDLAIVTLVVIAIAIMILPLPQPLIDTLIAWNIGASALVLMVSLYLDRPTKFSTLPATILIATLLRLATEVAVTRLVLVEADAGNIVRAFGDFVVAGNVVVGLATFLIITVVQFIVITKGSERVAEVAARFSLDALPGKQMSIDSDLRAGDISQDEARRQRHLLSQESQLFGAMDGAMKFVKGDAIAGLVIVVINLIGGIAVGCLQHHMPIGEAIQTYSLLTVGDGLVAQIPALLISFAAGTVVTRVAAEQPRDLGTDIVRQVMREPRALIVTATVLVLLSAVPGFPTAIFLLLAAGAGAGALSLHRRQALATERSAEAEPATPVAELEAPPSEGPVLMALSPDLAVRLDLALLGRRLAERQAALAERFGIELPRPAVRLDPSLNGTAFRLDIDDVPAAGGMLDETDEGLETLPSAMARAITGALEHFMGVQEARRLLNGAEADYGDLVQEVQRVASIATIADVFRRLLDEGVALRPLKLILGALVEAGTRDQEAGLLVERARAALRRQICHAHADAKGVLRVIILEREAEDLVRTSIRQTSAGPSLRLTDEALTALVDGVRGHLEAAPDDGPRPVLLASFDIRRLLRGLLVRQELPLAVLSYQELSRDVSVRSLGFVNCGGVAVPPGGLHLIETGESANAAE